MNITDNDLKISAQRALLGQVTPTLRSASIEIKDHLIIWQGVFDNSATAADQELLRVAGSEIIADFPDCQIREDMVIVPAPTAIIHLKNIVYMRNEFN